MSWRELEGLADQDVQVSLQDSPAGSVRVVIEVGWGDDVPAKSLSLSLRQLSLLRSLLEDLEAISVQRGTVDWRHYLGLGLDIPPGLESDAMKHLRETWARQEERHVQLVPGESWEIPVADRIERLASFGACLRQASLFRIVGNGERFTETRGLVNDLVAVSEWARALQDDNEACHLAVERQEERVEALRETLAFIRSRAAFVIPGAPLASDGQLERDLYDLAETALNEDRSIARRW